MASTAATTKMTPAQYVRQHHPRAKRETCDHGFKITADRTVIGRSNFPNGAWQDAANNVKRRVTGSDQPY